MHAARLRVPTIAVLALLLPIGLSSCSFFLTTVDTPYGTFAKVTLLTAGADPAPDFDAPAFIKVGPDGKLYVTTYKGILFVLTLDDDKAVADVRQYTPFPGRMLTGLAFDPDAPASEPVLYVTNVASPIYEAPDFSGRVSRLSGPGFGTAVDVIDGLPRSFENHMTFGLAFGADGRLYIAQGGNTNHGLPSPGIFGNRAESALSAALLVADVNDAGFTGINDVMVYAPGLRNPYGFCIHSNGYMYMEDQGGNKGFGGRPGPNGVGSLDVDEEQADELNRIVPNSYYGHPNPARNQFEWQENLADGTPHVPPVATFPPGSVVTGLAEYASSAQHGKLQGFLLLTGFLDDNLYAVGLSADGSTVTEMNAFAAGLSNPLDLTVGPDGTIYILEAGASHSFGGFGPAKLTALIPEEGVEDE